MKKTHLTSALGAMAVLASLPASAMDILARVISSTPVVQQVAVPRQVCNNQPMIVQSPNSGAGALMGALAGGAAGNAIGDGGGRALATMIGLVGGALVGDRIEGSNNQVQNVQQCTTQTFYENRPSHFNVVYEYQGTQYTTQLATDPGPYVRLQVTPVGAITPQAQSPFQPQPQQYQQPQQIYQAPVVQQPVYVQPVLAPPVVYQTYPVYAPRPRYYGPAYYPPVGLSFNFGYSRGHGHRHRHWR